MIPRKNAILVGFVVTSARTATTYRPSIDPRFFAIFPQF
jgi:hypothetical protein